MFKQANVLLFMLTVPLRKGTDTVYSELKNPPHGECNIFKAALVNIFILAMDQMTEYELRKGFFFDKPKENYH